MTFKSFLDRLWSDKGTGASPQHEGSVQWREKRKDNRVELEPEKHLMVHLLNPEGGEAASTLIARVRNVSMRGCGLIFNSKGDRDKIKMDQIFVASLAVDDFPIPLNVKVVRLAAEVEAAVQFKPPYPRELEKLERFLEPRCLGRSLREIDPSILQETHRKGMRWFQGVNETNLFSWDAPDSSRIVQQQLIFLDRVVEWRSGATVRTGRVRQDAPSVEGGIDWVRSELLDFDFSPDSNVLAQAQILLEASLIQDSVKKKFLEKIKLT